MEPTTADRLSIDSRKRIKKAGTAFLTTHVFLSAGLLLLFSCPASAVPTISPGSSADLTISDVGSAFFNTSTNRSRVAQMAFGPGPDVNKSYLYTATNGSGFATPALDGVYRFDYDPATGTLSNSALVVGINGSGIAFHNGSMYLSEPYQSTGGRGLSRVWRITDVDGDGLFSDAGTTETQIVQGIPSNGHTANQIQITGNSLYVTVGTNTSNGAFGGNGGAAGDSAYNGAINVIADLTQVSSTTNSAGFFPSNPSNSQYNNLVNGTDPSAALPFTSTAADKLRVHSSGTRNPFGIAVDGDGEVWFSNNSQRVDNDVYDRDNIANAAPDSFSSNPFGLNNDVYDQFFKAEEFADYGSRNANWQTSATAQAAGFFLPENRRKSFTFDNYVDPDAVDAEGNPTDFDNLDPAFNVDHDSAAPVGLGPSSSSNGLDFYDGNALGFEYQKDAFIARFVGTVPDGNFGGTSPPITYRDVVSVDTDTGKVNRIAEGFNSPLDVLADPAGNLLVADWNGSIYRIEAANPFTGTHPFNWDSDSDGNWSDRLTWNTNLSADDRLVPHAWGTARYAVTIDRAAGSPVITLDQNATIESLLLADQLHLGSGNVLTVQDLLTVAPGGILSGTGSVAGPVSVTGGTVAPGESTGILTADSATFDLNSTLAIELTGSGGVAGTDFDQLLVTNTVTLGGDLTIYLLDGFMPFATDTFTVLSAGTLGGSFSNVANGARLDTFDGAASLLVSYDGATDTVVLSDFMPSLDGDFDLNGVVNGLDFLKWQRGESPIPLSSSDLNDWETNYGVVAPLSETSAANVPEPSSLLLGTMASLGLMFRWRSIKGAKGEWH